MGTVKTAYGYTEGDYTVPIGKAAIRREGTDVTIVSFNKMRNY